MNFTEMLQSYTGKPLADCTNQELYLALLEIVRHKSADKVQPVTGRKLYYISAEFLIGKLLSNNLINLGLYDDARAALAAAGKSLSEIEEVEPEPSLGNGGLGRLAACFLDSLATLGLPGDGVGLRYHFGLFHQSFENGLQNEKPDPWLTAHSWAEKTDITYPVQLAGKEYTARLYKLAVTGYGARTNTLNLFDLDSIDESIVHDGIAFDKTDIDKNLTLFLYPDDSDEAGRRLRVYQQYLMVSAGAQLILAECAARGCDYHDLADYAAIQINDTHPSMVIPELIRLLGEKGIEFEEAVEIVTKTCAYTNHTILAEALEKWPRAYLDAVLKGLVEQAEVIAQAHAVAGQVQRCQRIQEAGSQTAQAAIAQRRFGLHFFNVGQVLACGGQGLACFIVQTKVDQVVGQQLSDEKLCADIIQFAAGDGLDAVCAFLPDDLQQSQIQLLIRAVCQRFASEVL